MALFLGGEGVGIGGGGASPKSQNALTAEQAAEKKLMQCQHHLKEAGQPTCK